MTEKTPTSLLTPKDLTDYLQDVADRTAWAICPQCEREWNALLDEGICIGCVDQRGKQEAHQKRLGDYLLKVIGAYGIERYSFLKFETDSDNAYAFSAFKTFDHTKDNLFIFGGCGTGKTHLAGALLKDCCAKGLQVKFVNPIYVTRLLKSRFPSEEDGIIEGLVSQDVLIVDDLGIGSDLAMTLRAIYEITDRRRAQNRNGLVITSNLSLDDLAAAYRDDRIASRIAGMCKLIEIKGPDRRIKR